MNTHRQPNGASWIRLDLQFETQQTEIGKLLDIARMEDYQPGNYWHRAFRSFGQPAWRRLIKESADEPRLIELAERCAMQRYKGDETPEQAAAILETIAVEAVHDEEYSRRSCRGWAVDLIAPMLDGTKLARNLLRSLNRSGCGWQLRPFTFRCCIPDETQ